MAVGTDPSWSPDGSLLLFKAFDAARKELWVITARRDGRDLRRLARGVHPQWSPDGARIVFMQDRGMASDIWVMAADGLDRRCLTCRQ